jgi:ribosomal protein S27E
MVLLVGLGVTFALAGLVSVGFYLRQRVAARRLSARGTQQSTTQGSVAVMCPECGRNLKIKAELAGKKVKCPQCGKAIVVPQPTRPSKTGFIILAAGLLAVLGLVAVFLCFWTFRPTTSFLDIPLGNRSVPGVADSGFYYDENDNEGPFRWTNGKGKLVIPLLKNDRPQALLVQLDRLENCALQITVNDREVLKEGPSPNRVIWWEKTIDLRGVLLGKEVIQEVIVEIVSNTRPDPNDNSRREIGVTVRGIKLLSRRGDDKEEETMRSSSLLNVTLGNHIVPGMEESGFHPTERGNDGRFRWTKGKARLVIPLDKKERPQAILVQLGLPKFRSVRITANDHELLNEIAREQGPVVEWLWEKTFDVSGIDLGNKVTLEIFSNVEPLLVDPRGDKVDARELGVALRGIKLLGANK